MVTSYTLGGVVHLLLVIALVVIVFPFISAAGPSDGGPVKCAVGVMPAPHEAVQIARGIAGVSAVKNDVQIK